MSVLLLFNAESFADTIWLKALAGGDVEFTANGGADVVTWPGALATTDPALVSIARNVPADTVELFVDGQSQGEQAYAVDFDPDQLLSLGRGAATGGPLLIGAAAAYDRLLTGTEHAEFAELLVEAERSGGDLVRPAAFATVEQDSQAEVAQSVYAICATLIGQRSDLPEFGISALPFRKGGPDLAELTAAVEQWEPRAEVVFGADLAGAIERIAGAVEVRE